MKSKVKRDEFWWKAYHFLKAGSFSRFHPLTGELFCSMKFRDPDAQPGQMPEKFGLIFESDLTTIHIVEQYNTTGEAEKFDSLAQLLDSGWDVD